jgi:hypothetical protein
MSFAWAQGAAASKLECRILYRMTCAPDLCSPMDKVVNETPQIPRIRIVISANRKRLTYIEGKTVRKAVISVKRLRDSLRLVSGKIRWPSYERGVLGSRKAPLGRVRMIFDGTSYYWRVGYLGTNESQEYEDILIGDCLSGHW